MVTKVFRVFLLAVFLLSLSGRSSTVSAQTIQIKRGSLLVVRADNNPSTLRVPAPAGFAMRPSSVAANIIVDYAPAGCMAFPADAQTAYQYAVDIWASLVTVTVPIRVDACWESLGAGVLGQAGPLMVDGFSGQPVADTYYPLGLANILAGHVLYPSSPDIQSSFNSDFGSWYFGTDGNPGAGKYDFASVVLHELGHGLGFVGNIDPGGVPPIPTIFDRLTEDKNGTRLTTLSGSALVAVLTGDKTGNPAYFGGTHAKSANGGSRVPLYSPTSWSPGSSYSHLGDSYNGTANASMTYSLSPGESLHNPGPVTIGIMADLGWQVAAAQTAPNPPSNLSALGSAGQIDLSWQDNSSNETGFEVERSPDGSTGWAKIATAAANATSYANSGLAQAALYFYRVRAVNGVLASAYTANASASTLSAPVAPSNLSAVGSFTNQIDLSWQDNSADETGFEVERSPDGSTGWAKIVTTAANANAYADTPLPQSTRYYYRVRAVRGTQPSAYTSVASAYTLGPPAAPSNLTATASGLDKVILKWTDNSANETGFRIERYDNVALAWAALPDVGPNVVTLTDTGLSAGKTYSYRIRAFIGVYASDPFGPIDVTTWAKIFKLALPYLRN